MLDIVILLVSVRAHLKFSCTELGMNPMIAEALSVGFGSTKAYLYDTSICPSLQYFKLLQPIFCDILQRYFYLWVVPKPTKPTIIVGIIIMVGIIIIVFGSRAK